MRLILCSVFDSKVGAYAAPHTFKSKGEAIRAFTDSVKAPDSPFSRHPGDYRFFVLGEFDDETGTVVSLTAPAPLIGADEIG